MTPEDFKGITAEQLLVGGDPEFFLYDRNSDEFVSAHNLLPGTKQNPHKLDCGHVQVDGTAVEFNIDPAKTEDEFVSNVFGAIKCIRAMLPARYEFIYRGSATYTASQYKKIPAKALELGCNPDWSAYTFAHNPAPDASRTPTMRTAAGHVTIGWLNGDKQLSDIDVQSFPNILMCGRIARNLDITLGLQSLTWDRDKHRRILYGRAGAFRPKPFGIEYRVMSCSWLNREDLMRRVYKGAVEGVLDFFNNSPDCMFMQHRQEDVMRQLGG